jgi:hypothetical protein
VHRNSAASHQNLDYLADNPATGSTEIEEDK